MNVSEPLRMEQKGWIEEDEVINEALEEEVRREEQRNKRSDRVAAAIPETKRAAQAVSEPREDPIEPDPNRRGDRS